VNAPDRRFEDLQREVAALRRLLEATRAEVAELRDGTHADSAEPVTLKDAARIAGVSADTIYRDPERYGGWKVDPSKPKSQWRFDPERVRQITGAAPPVSLPDPGRRGRSTVPLLPVKDRAA
jgi:hypothetical protein